MTIPKCTPSMDLRCCPYRVQVLSMIHQLAIRLGASCVLLATLPLATDEIIKYTQAPHIFSGIGAIASCMGACVPVLTLFRNSD